MLVSFMPKVLQNRYMGSIASFRDDFYNKSDAIYTNVAARFARGNVAMQMGHILTREQLDKELDALELKVLARKK